MAFHRLLQEHNKPPPDQLDVSSLNERSASTNNSTASVVPAVRTNDCGKVGRLDIIGDVSCSNKPPGPSTVTIKTEPKDETGGEDHGSNLRGRGISYGKHKGDKDEEDVYARAKRLRRYSNCSSEDLTQLESEKYRELRNKNNEASRRSRANRKSREVEMRDHALKLEAENRRLKVKADEMEKLVKRLRNCLMQLVLKRR